MGETISAVIKENGSFVIKVEGMAGKGCYAKTGELYKIMAKLGVKTDVVKDTPTGDMYQEQATGVQQSNI